MANPNAELQAASAHFSTQPGVNTVQATQLRAAIASNPALLDKLIQSAHAGHFTCFAIQAPGAAPSATIFNKLFISME